jgi:hypothetical protein
MSRRVRAPRPRCKRVLGMVVALGVLALAAPAAAQGQPHIFANLTPLTADVGGEDFTPGATVNFELFDSPGGSLLASFVLTVDGDGNFGVSEPLAGGDLAPGMHLVADDGTTVKELTVADMSFDVLDPDNDTASGTAPPGAQVLLELFQGPSEFATDTTADGGGDWTIDLGAESFDVTNATGQAKVFDLDGDDTRADWGAPSFGTSLNLDLVFGHRHNSGGFFTPGGTVTVEIFSMEGGTLLFSDTQPIGASNPLGSFEFGPEDHGLDLVPGMYVTASDNATGITKELTLVAITFDVLDPVNDVAAGTAPPGDPLFLQVQVVDPEDTAEDDPVVLGEITPADANGDWLFVHPDAAIEPDMRGTICHADLDGDCSAADYVAAPQAITSLSGEVDAIEAAGGLNHGHAQSLQNKLDNADKHLAKDNVPQAIDKLEKFVDRAGELVDKGKLGAADGQNLIDGGNAIVTGLGG